MDYEKAYDSIAILEVEISSFANEGYKVKYDFRRKVISWRDNYMWNNNFTRSINEANYKLLRTELPRIGILEWIKSYNDGDESCGKKTSIPSEWKISVQFDDNKTVKGGAMQHFPQKWSALKALIEQTTGCNFTLR